jgi:hypothetical protein
VALAYSDMDATKPGVETPTLKVSTDDGSSWGQAVTLNAAAAVRALPSMDVCADGTIFATFFQAVGNGTGPQARRDYRAVAVQGTLVGNLTLDAGIEGPSGALGDYMGASCTPQGAYTVWVTHHGDAYDVIGAPLRLRSTWPT